MRKKKNICLDKCGAQQYMLWMCYICALSNIIAFGEKFTCLLWMKCFPVFVFHSVRIFCLIKWFKRCYTHNSLPSDPYQWMNIELKQETCVMSEMKCWILNLKLISISKRLKHHLNICLVEFNHAEFERPH